MKLAKQTAHDITANTSTYMSFLTTAAHNFKYSFSDQLLIFAQKPKATACAEIDFWNRCGRWANKGVSGIALLADTNAKYKLRHVFDVSDTNSYAGNTVPVWRMEPDFYAPVLEKLGTGGDDFAEGLIQAAKSMTADSIDEYFADLLDIKTGSLLEELDEQNTKVWLKSTVQNSVAFMLLTRCGIDAKAYFDAEDFRRVCDFNTPEVLSILGAAVSDTAERGLREIAKTVNLLRREKNRNRTFAERKNTGYDGVRKNERGLENGDNLPEGRRLSAAEPDSTEAAKDREIRSDATDISAGAPQRNLHGYAADGQIKQPPGGRGQAGAGNGGPAGDAAGESSGRDREPESIRPTPVGGADEQYPGTSGGNSTGGDSVRLKPEEEQRQNIAEAEAEKASAFVISQEDIDSILLGGGIVFGGKKRIYEQFLKHESDTENAKFLKNEYGTGGVFPAISSRKLDEWHNGKGITISRGSVSGPDAKVTITWAKAAKRIGELIAADRYLSPAEKEKYFGRTTKNYRPSSGDTVYIGTQEYTVLSLSDQTVRLSDAAFPLFETEMPRDEFERKLGENPLNDRLLERADAEPEQTDTALENAKQLINEYCMKTFEQEADFSDLHSVDLAMRGTADGEHTVLVSADLVRFRLLYQVDGEEALTLQCHDLDDLNVHLAKLNFDELVSLAEAEYKKGLNKADNTQVLQAETEIEPASNESPKLQTAPNLHDYRITDDTIGAGTPGTRFNNNVRAIRLLKKLESENRLAAPDEQAVMSQYVGWEAWQTALTKTTASTPS